MKNQNQEEKIVLSSQKKTKKPVVLAACAVAACAIIGTGAGALHNGSLAYLTDADHKTNEFTNGSVDTDVSEPNWPGDQTETTPGDVIAKDPIITAKTDSDVPAYVYFQVKVPKANVTKVNDNGTLVDKNADETAKEVVHQLITYGMGETGNTVDSFDTSHGLTTNINDTATGWTLIKTETTGRAVKDDARITGYNVYTYAYNSMLACTVKMNDTFKGNACIVDNTTPLFNKVHLINCIEGQLDGCNFQMPIKSFVIQSAHTGSDTDKDSNNVPDKTADVITAANAAFTKYANQNEVNGNATTLPGDFVVD